MTNKIDLTSCAANFLNELVFTKHAPSNTSKSYANDMNQLLDHENLPKIFYRPEPDPLFFSYKPEVFTDVSHQNILRIFNQSLRQWSSLAPSSKNRKASTVKQFARWLFEKKHLDFDLSSQISAPSVPKKVPFFLSLDEILSIVKYLRFEQENKGQKGAKRHYLLFFLLYGGGLRVSEACFLSWKDFSKEFSQATIIGKGGKQRIVIFPPIVGTILNNSPRLGSSIWGHEPLTSSQAYYAIKKLGKLAGINRQLHPHALRHSYATHLLSSGANLRVLQKLLGHTNLVATEKYTHLDIHKLSSIMEEHHPLKNKIESD